MQTFHRRNIRSEYFRDIVLRKKNFEIVKDDDILSIKEGDMIVFLELDQNKVYTGKECKRKVKYVLRDCSEYGLKFGCCIVSW